MHCGQVRARLAEIFPKIDTNHDMHIDQPEMLAWHDANGDHASAFLLPPCTCHAIVASPHCRAAAQHAGPGLHVAISGALSRNSL